MEEGEVEKILHNQLSVKQFYFHHYDILAKTVVNYCFKQIQ